MTENNELHSSKQECEVDTFDTLEYAMEFDFCTNKEKCRLMIVLDEAWKWGIAIQR